MHPVFEAFPWYVQRNLVPGGSAGPHSGQCQAGAPGHPLGNVSAPPPALHCFRSACAGSHCVVAILLRNPCAAQAYPAAQVEWLVIAYVQAHFPR